MTEKPDGWTALRPGMWVKDEDLERWCANPAPSMLRVYPSPSEFTPTELGERIRGDEHPFITLCKGGDGGTMTPGERAYYEAFRERPEGDGDKAA